MMLWQSTPGDYVAIELHGELIVVEVGRVLGREGTKKRAFQPTGVIANRLDPFTFKSIPFSESHAFPTSLLDPHIEVVEVVAPVAFLRRLRYVGPARVLAAAAKADDDDRDVDPMQRMHDDANKNALLDWVEERRANPPPYDDDIPF